MPPPGARDLPFGPGRPPWVLRIGARPVGLDRWLDLEGDVVAALTAKARTRAVAAQGDVVASLAGSDAAGDELRDEVVRAVLADEERRWHQEGGLVRTPSGDAVDVARGPGIDVAGRLVPDDLLLLDGDDGHRLIAASVASPNRWRLADKLGATLTAVHEPVPGFADGLAAPVGRLVASLRPDRAVERRNWSVTDTEELYQPKAAPPVAGLGPDDVPDRLWLRIERQSLRRLPRTGAVAFTIRTRQWPLGSLTAPAVEGLAAAVENLPSALAAYKGLATYREPILAWLHRQPGHQRG